MWNGALLPRTTSASGAFGPPAPPPPSSASAHLPRSIKDAHPVGRIRKGMVMVRASSGDDQTFLTLEEAGLIELSTLDMHERFLCRLTVSSLNLLRVISKQEGKAIEDLNAGIICDWFQKDKEKREKDFDSATLKW